MISKLLIAVCKRSIMTKQPKPYPLARVVYSRTSRAREHLWNHESKFETGVVRANEC